jgi:hypothetical protein
VERIVKEGNRAGHVIMRIRALSKRKDPQRTALDVNDVIQETLGLIDAELSENHVSVSADLAPALPTVFADRVQLQQVILNLAMNGIESMRTASEGPRELAVGSRLADDNRVAVTIRDNGTGFSSDETAQFFEPFFTTKAQGTGLGLSISRNIVEAHGGNIRAFANADYGATFEIHGFGTIGFRPALLPLAAGARETAGRSLTVLVLLGPDSSSHSVARNSWRASKKWVLCGGQWDRTTCRVSSGHVAFHMFGDKSQLCPKSVKFLTAGAV